MLSILLAHAFELVLGLKVPEGANALGRMVLASEQTLLGFRALVFSLPALLFAWLSLRLRGQKIDRESLRAPFFAQCYLSGATAIVVSVGFGGSRLPGDGATLGGLAVILVSTIWYLWVQWRWVREESNLGPFKVTLATGATFASAMAIVVVATVLVSQ